MVHPLGAEIVVGKDGEEGSSILNGKKRRRQDDQPTIRE